MSTDAMRAAALKIVAAYDAYRHRGMAPAPGEYAGVVAAIEEARAALAQPVSAERVPLTDEAAPVATDARSMLEFLSARFKHAGVSEAVAESYARDIDAILAAEAKPTRVPLTDDQIDALSLEQWGVGYPDIMYRAWRAFARAIERAHGIGEPQ